MPRPLLKKKQQQNRILTAAPSRTAAKQKMDQAALDQLLRRNRSAAYVQAMTRLDGGQSSLESRTEGIIRQMQAEFPEIAFTDILRGIVAKCYLGEPYEVHTLTIAGNIITHYKRGQALPGGLEKARTLAACGAYAFIEVYDSCCRAVSEDGSVSVVPG